MPGISLPKSKGNFATCLLATFIFANGCKKEAPPGPPKLVPVSGKVTHEGKPLAGAVVVFNPSGTEGNLSIGETDANGEFKLSHMNFPGCSAGQYKVGVSLKLNSKGKTVSLSEQSALAPSAETMRAVEVIPDQYSSLGKTTLTAIVKPEGGTFSFNLEGKLLDPPPSTDDKTTPVSIAPAATNDSKTKMP
ncbi:MAG: hypothetical protein ACKO5E_10185 [bacterium]